VNRRRWGLPLGGVEGCLEKMRFYVSHQINGLKHAHCHLLVRVFFVGIFFDKLCMFVVRLLFFLFRVTANVTAVGLHYFARFDLISSVYCLTTVGPVQSVETVLLMRWRSLL